MSSQIVVNHSEMTYFYWLCKACLETVFQSPFSCTILSALWFMDEIKLILQKINGSNKSFNYILLIEKIININ